MHSVGRFTRPWNGVFVGFSVAFAAATVISGCKNEDNSGFAAKAAVVVAVQPCEAVTGTPWVPNVAGTGASNHDASVTVSQQVVDASGPLTGIAQAAGAGQEISVSIDMTEDLGTSGSLTLVAEMTSFPSSKQGSAYPMLVALSDGTNEYVNLARTGAGGDCAASGYYSWDGTNVSQNPACTVSWPSAFSDYSHWEQHQIAVLGYASVNTFPTCNWVGGTNGSTTVPACAFNSGFFQGGKLRSGVTYTAKYVLLAGSYLSIPPGNTASFRVTAIRKKSPRASVGGAVDLNVILVGQKNIIDSHTTSGKNNLDTLFTAVQNYLAQSSTGVSLGEIRVYEWGCADGGETFANAGLDSETDANYVGKMFETGSRSVPAAGAGRALNIFLTSSINKTMSTSLLKIAGMAGGISGPPINGLPNSGLAFASMEKLASFNPLCHMSPCPASAQEPAFWDMGSTIAHEIGHYLGLNHPSESDGTMHDGVLDTPICTKTGSIGGQSMITISSCLQDTNVHPVTGKTCSQGCGSYDSNSGTFCAAAVECQFNHLMWWVSKNYNQSLGVGDGNLLSSQSGGVISYSPFVQ